MGKRWLLPRGCLHAAPLHVSPGLAWRSCDASCLRLSLLCFSPLSFCPFLLFIPVAVPPPCPLYPLPSSHLSMRVYSSVGHWGPSHFLSVPLMLLRLRCSISVEFHFPL